MPDVTWLQSASGKNPWTDPDFNTCSIVVPEPGLSLPYDSMKAKETTETSSSSSSDKGCNWTLVGNDLYNKNQDGQVLVGTKRPSNYLSRAVISKSGEYGENTNFLELENKAYGPENIWTRSSIIWTMYYPDNDQSRVIGRFGAGIQGEWSSQTFSDWSYVFEWGESAILGGPLAVASDGQFFYVLSIYSGDHDLKKVTAAEGTLIAEAGTSGSGPTQFNFAAESDICYYNGNLYITDTNNNRVKVYLASDLSVVTSFGTGGSSDGQFSGPTGIYVDSSGIYVVDTGNARLQKFSVSTYAFVSKYGSSGSGDAQFNNPTRMASDGTYLWVADLVNNRVKKHLVLDFSFVSKASTINGVLLDYVTDVYYSDGYIYVGITQPTQTIYKATGDFTYVSALGLSTGLADCIVAHDKYIAVGQYATTATRKLFCFFYRADTETFYSADGFFHWKLTQAGVEYERMRLTSEGYLLVGRTSGSQRVDISGNYRTDSQFISTLAVGTKPIDVTSTTLCTNLNADMVDGVHMGTMTANRLLYTSALGTVSVIATSVSDGTSAAIGTTTLPTDPGSPLWTVSGAASITSAIHGTTAATFVNLQFRNENADKTWHLTMRNDAHASPYNLGIWYHNGTAWAEFGHFKTTGELSWPFQIISTLAGGGVSPFACTSTVVCTNLNADLLDGNHAAAFAPASHSILSATHGDSTAAAVVRGDLIVGIGATPKWTRYALSVPAANVRNVLGVDNAETEPTWKAALDATVPTTIAESAAAAAGTSLIFSHRDHTHGAPATWTPSAHNHAGVYEPVIAAGTTAQYWRGDKTWQTLNQAAVAGLTTADSPSFVTVKCSGLTDGYIPYHVNDAAGLANGPLYTNATNVGLGTTAVTNNLLHVVESRPLVIGDTTPSIYNETTATGDLSSGFFGVIIGLASIITNNTAHSGGGVVNVVACSSQAYNPAGYTCGGVYGYVGGGICQHTTGTVAGVYGVSASASVTGAGGTTSAAYGIKAAVAATAGTITAAYGGSFGVSNPGGSIGTGYGVYIEAVTATVAWGLYQGTAANSNYFAGNLGLGQTTFGTSATKTLAVSSGTAPSTSPADAFQMYSADFAAGNACPYFRTENGTVIGLNQSLLTTSTPTFNGATFTDQPRGSTSLYRRYYHIPLGTSNPGSSGATWTDASANTTGGWRLDAAGETIRGGTDIHSDWDGASDMKVEVRFAVMVAGSGAGDTVDLRLICYYNGVGDTATKTQTVEVATTVGAAAQYKVFTATFTIDYNPVGALVDAGDHLSFYLNLETDTSEVDDVIILGMSFSYLTTHLGIEDGDE